MRPLFQWLLFFSVVITSPDIFAASTPIAKVVKLRGIVTELSPGALDATTLAEGEDIFESTSIVTGSKSSVKIDLVDKSELNIGPDSRIIISEKGIISVLKGRVRVEVQKSQNKLFIRTRSAALGVQGSDFQLIYNPDNNVTSVLTFKGSVALAKIDEETNRKLEEGRPVIVRDSSDLKKIPELEKIPAKPLSERSALTKILKGKDVVLIPSGQNSFTSGALKKASLPVKISPTQFNALYKNRTFEEINVLNIRSGNALQNVESMKYVADQVTSPHGVYNSKNDFSPRAGGFIDQNTGFYIAPNASALFNEKQGIYVEDRLGDIDADTGQYFAPQGIILDAESGFTVGARENVMPEFLALKEDLNQSIARDVVLGKLESEAIFANRTLNEKFIRSKLSFSLMSGSEDVFLNEGATNIINTDSDSKFSLLWQMASANRFAATLGISYASVKYITQQNYQDSKGLFSLAAGAKYALTNRLDITSSLSLDQAHYENQNLANTGNNLITFQFKKIVVTKVSLGLSYELVRAGNWGMVIDGAAKFGFRKRYNDLVISSVNGYDFKFTPQYNFSERKSLGIGYFMNHENSNLENSFGLNEQKRKSRGVELKYMVELL